MIIRTIAVLLLAAACAFAQNTPAEQREPQTTQDPNEDSIEVRDIRESSAKDVGEALQSVAGVSKVRKGGIANDIVLRGFQQDNINVQIDGARIYGACPNNMDPSASHVDFAEVERVEVVKGPFDVRSQGSLGGAVKIVTRAEEFSGIRFVPNFNYGSFGYYNPSFEVSAARRIANFAAGYAYRTSEAYEDGHGRRFTSYGNFRPEIRDSNAFDGHSGWGSLSFSPGRNRSLELGYSRQQNGLTLYPYLMMDAIYDNADRGTAKYSLRNGTGLVRDVHIEGYGTKVNHLMDDARRTSSGLLPYSMRTHAVTSAIGFDAAIDMAANLTVGVDSSRRTWNALTRMRNAMGERAQNSMPDVSIASIGAFAEFDRQVAKRVRLQAGARFDRITSEASTSAAPNLYFAYNNTRARDANDTLAGGNARLSIAVNKKIDVFAGIGSTARVPDPQERFFSLQRMGQDWVGNALLQPTRNTEADLGITLRHRNVLLRVLVFHSTLSDYIALHRQARINAEPGVMNIVSQSYTNLDARIYGGEITGSVPIGKTVAVAGGASISRGSKDVNSATAVLDSNLSEMPPTKSWLNVRYANRWLYAQVGGTATGAQRRVNRDLNEQPTPGYFVLNTKIGVHRDRLNLQFGVDNLLNRFYYESFSYSRDPFRSGLKVAEPGRSIFVSGSYRF